ncbi:MAG TPA: CRISPR-associated endonuclease Cas2 [Candidatus Ozemobacteraceae bacterium]
MSGMFYIVCYDTPSDKRRRKLHKMLKNYAIPVQESVFETFLEGPRFDELLRRLVPLIDPAVDSVRIYGMTREAQHRMHVFGLPGLLEDPDHLIVSDASNGLDAAPTDLGDEADDPLET